MGQLTRVEQEQLDNIARCTYVADGDLISKKATQSLVKKGLVERFCGGYILKVEGEAL